MTVMIKYAVYTLILDTLTKYFENHNDLNIAPERYIPFLNAIHDQVEANKPTEEELEKIEFSHGYAMGIPISNKDDTVQLVPSLNNKTGPGRMFYFNLIYTHNVIVGKQIQSYPNMIVIRFKANMLYWNYLAGTDRLEQFMDQIYNTVIAYERLLSVNTSSGADAIITVPYFAQDSHSVVL